MRIGGAQVLFRTAAPAAGDAGLLGDEEHREAARYRRASDANRFVAGRALARRALEALTGTAAGAFELRRSPGGGVDVATGGERCGELRVSISHSGDCVACAATRGAEIGIDVERAAREFDERTLSPRVLAPAELRSLARIDDRERRHRRFLDYWTLKEALAKATGRGIAIGLCDLAFALDGGRIRLSSDLEAVSPAGDWRFFRPAAPTGYLAALAVRTLPEG